MSIDSETARRIDAVRTLRDWRQLERDGYLGELGPESVGALVSLAGRTEKGTWRREKTFAFLVILPLIYLVCVVLGIGKEVRATLLVQFSLMQLVTAGGLVGYWATSRQQRAVAVLSRLDSPELFPVMVGALTMPSKRSVLIAQEWLVRFLVRLPSHDYLALEADAREALYHPGPYRTSQFLAAVVTAAGRAEDIDGIIFVRRIINMRFIGGYRDQSVRQAAQVCLATLEAKVERDGLAVSLLRPAESPSDTTLLQPATTPADHKNLLHVIPDSPETRQQIGTES